MLQQYHTKLKGTLALTDSYLTEKALQKEKGLYTGFTRPECTGLLCRPYPRAEPDEYRGTKRKFFLLAGKF